jgi:dihydroorotate dehydrogenase
LGAGVDKNGQFLDHFFRIGFKMLEVGSVTLRPQSGHPPPNLWLDDKNKLMHNTLGAPSVGIHEVLVNISGFRHKHPEAILGMNFINMRTSFEAKTIIDEFKELFTLAAPYVDYVVINLSCPNLCLSYSQEYCFLTCLLSELKLLQMFTQKQSEKYIPILLKVACYFRIPELTRVILATDVDGVIAINSTESGEKGFPTGISGSVLKSHMLRCVKQWRSCLPANKKVIASGGVLTSEDIKDAIASGASSVQLCSAVYLDRHHSILAHL